MLGVGTQPVLPAAVQQQDSPAVHSADYLTHRDTLVAADSVTIVGSGQSAAEIYRDLLGTPGRLDWVTRSPRFFPMEYTKLTLELTSPEYTDYFHALPADVRTRLGREQRSLYKGISGDLVDDIFDTLYRRAWTARCRRRCRPTPKLPGRRGRRRVRPDPAAHPAGPGLRAPHGRAGARHRVRRAGPRRRARHPAPARLGRHLGDSAVGGATTRSTAVAGACSWRTPRSTRTG